MSDEEERAHCVAVANEMKRNAMMRVEPTAVAIIERERAAAFEAGRKATFKYHGLALQQSLTLCESDLAACKAEFVQLSDSFIAEQNAHAACKAKLARVEAALDQFVELADRLRDPSKNSGKASTFIIAGVCADEIDAILRAVNGGDGSHGGDFASAGTSGDKP